MFHAIGAPRFLCHANSRILSGLHRIFSDYQFHPRHQWQDFGCASALCDSMASASSAVGLELTSSVLLVKFFSGRKD
jgi:hypothetical protein